MGYRTYIGSMPKKEYNKIKSMTRHELYGFYKESKKLENDTPDDFYLGPYDFGNTLYEFGKYTDFQPPKGSMKSFFKKKETKEHYNDEDELYLVTKEFLAYIIETYNNKIKKYYNDMMLPFLDVKGRFPEKESFLDSVKTDYGYENDKYTFDFTKITDEQQTALYKIIQHVRDFRTEWTCLTPYNLEKGDEITGSWKFEYGVFELVRIYKSFDWKKNVMIYYGY